MTERHHTISGAFRAVLEERIVRPEPSVSIVKKVLITLAVQTAKTIKHPERIIFFGITLPGIILRRAIRRFLFNIQSLIDFIPARLLLPKVRSALATENVIAGGKYLAENDPETAWKYLRRCLRTSSDPHHFFLGAVCLMVGLGRFNEAMDLFEKANALRRRKAIDLGLKGNPIRFLDIFWVGSFGHLAQTDYFIKADILAGRTRENRLMYVPASTPVANRFLFDQLRSHLTVHEREADLPLPLDSLAALSVDFLAPRQPDGSTVHLWKAAADTYRKWHAEGFGPVFAFPEDVRQAALEQLKSAGLPPGAWFATLHVRERTSKHHHAELHSVLDATVYDYIPAIHEVVKRGGWVIRIGDPSMKPLPPMSNVLDCCHSSIRSEWMDIFLLSSCRFFIGTSSGPAYVPSIYGVPCVHTNWWPPAQRPWFEQDIFIPKVYRKTSGSDLSLLQSLAEPFGYCNSVAYLQRAHGVMVENNSPIDIHAAVVEMLDRLDGRIENDESVDALRQRANRIYETSAVSGMAQLARGFLKRHHGFIN